MNYISEDHLMGRDRDLILCHVKSIQRELSEIATICLKLEARIDVLEAQLKVLHEIMRRKEDV